MLSAKGNNASCGACWRGVTYFAVEPCGVSHMWDNQSHVRGMPARPWLRSLGNDCVKSSRRRRARRRRRHMKRRGVRFPKSKCSIVLKISIMVTNDNGCYGYAQNYDTNNNNLIKSQRNTTPGRNERRHPVARPLWSCRSRRPSTKSLRRP